MNKCIRQGIQLGMCAVVLTCTACSQNDVEVPIGEIDGTGEPLHQAQEIDMNASSTGENLTEQVSGAIVDLASRTGVAADTINVTQARTVHWGSAAMGCPKKGMNYTQAIVPGVLVILEVDGAFYRYHGRMEGKLIYCPAERAQEPAYGPGKEFM